MPMLETRGAAAAKAFGMLASTTQNPNSYIENLFSTWLYTGNGSTQTITNGIDLSGKGGMVWIKDRTSAVKAQVLYDTIKGGGFLLSPSGDGTIVATNGYTYALSSNIGFTSSGFTLNTDSAYSVNNYYTDHNYTSWSFRKQAKFFDIVTYTGTGSARTIAHNLGSTPGCIIVKRTDTTSDWQVYHSGLTSAAYSIQLNSTAAQASAPTIWNSTAPTSSVFSVGTDASVNASGGTYVAYLFASNAGGFGSDGTQNVITCGSFTTDGSGNATVNLGYEPQWLLSKSASATGAWYLNDTMRGMSQTGMLDLYPNLANRETSDSGFIPTATGFTYTFAASTTYIYTAIRRGPMKTPTSGTSVFSPIIESTAGTTYTPGFTVDLQIQGVRSGGGSPQYFIDRLRGLNSTTSDSINVPYLSSASTGAEQPQAAFFPNNMWNTTYVQRNNSFSPTNVDWNFARAPGFFDEVCYTGTGSATTQAHNLGVAPELMIGKSRSNISDWPVYVSSLGATQHLLLDNTNGVATGSYFWNSTAPTSSVFSVGTANETNGSARTYVFYLFATLAGVSKVGTYTGTGATQTINCGFTGGARFVLIKRTDSTGDWYVWDTARGMVAGTDPYLRLDSGSPETNANNVYTTSVGFQIVGTDAGINANGGTYIFLAIS